MVRRPRVVMVAIVTVCSLLLPPAAGLCQIDSVRSQVLVKFRSDVTPDERRQTYSRTPALSNLRFDHVGWELVALPATHSINEALTQFRADPSIEKAQPNYIYDNVLLAVPNDPDFVRQWYLDNTGQAIGYDFEIEGCVAGADIDAVKAWDYINDASSVLVGVIDTGVDCLHPELTANMWSNTMEIPHNGIDDDSNDLIDDRRGYDFHLLSLELGREQPPAVGPSCSVLHLTLLAYKILRP